MTKNTYQFLDNPTLLQNTTRFWFVRHAIVNQKDREYLYGTMDVLLCPDHIKQQHHIYQHLANRLPQSTSWFTTSLSRTQDTAKLIQNAGYGQCPIQIDDSFLEQHLGDWQGKAHGVANQYYQYPPHPFWPFCAKEIPPNGETMYDVTKRVGKRLEQLTQTHQGQDVIIISHGGAIRAAIAHSLKIPVDSTLSLSIVNLSLTVLENNQNHWRGLTINEYPTF
ncbi:Broad specificity phosphatase PhoE (PhoE) (PDB:1EBB) [Commensalibacter communis]|uniref:histidine phosphatase family protein n=1 Tax=Commensalibacter communis TaxID=2972786 RepID=UPI0022FFC408|nr:histidine phosphatase family protein [Commensalibacter communis]CAI3941651.1 Broad specificity phosphatase PhoE (PhoE) (PDB:1EBB) [Commensalibacter communis]CAI3942956.1 Broad specificity phosphatase PhoE (PhoE) (PDB:1EBB) [Commensalibacter communis]